MRSQWFLCNLCGKKSRETTPRSLREKYSLSQRVELMKLGVCSMCLGRLQKLQNRPNSNRSLGEILARLRNTGSIKNDSPQPSL